MLGVVSGLVAFSVINAHGTLTTFTLTPMSAMFCWKRRAIFSSSGTSATQPNSNSTFFDFAWASAAFAAATSDRKSTRLNSSHQIISYAVFCLKKKKKKRRGYDD